MKGYREVLAAVFCSLATIASDAGGRPGEVDLHAVVATVGQLLEQSH